MLRLWSKRGTGVVWQATSRVRCQAADSVKPSSSHHDKAYRTSQFCTAYPTSLSKCHVQWQLLLEDTAYASQLQQLTLFPSRGWRISLRKRERLDGSDEVRVGRGCRLAHAGVAGTGAVCRAGHPSP